MSATATRAPSFAIATAPARPMPEPPPTTSAALPSSRPLTPAPPVPAGRPATAGTGPRCGSARQPRRRRSASTSTPSPGTVDATPVRPVRDRQLLAEHVVHHHLRRLLIALDGVRQRQQHVLAGGGRDAELAVGVLADLQALQLGDVREPRERAQRADPGGREAEHVGLAGADARVRVGLRPEALVRAHGDRRAPAHLAQVPDRRLAHGLLDEVDVVLGQPLQHAQRLRHGPVRVDVESQAWARAERLAQRRDHAQVVAVVQPDLEVEDVVAGAQRRRDLRAQIVVVAAGEVEEVRHVAAHGAAQEAPERLARRPCRRCRRAPCRCRPRRSCRSPRGTARGRS